MIVEIDGQQHEFPDGTSDAEIQAALGGAPADNTRAGGLKPPRRQQSERRTDMGRMPGWFAPVAAGIAPRVPVGASYRAAVEGAQLAPDVAATVASAASGGVPWWQAAGRVGFGRSGGEAITQNLLRLLGQDQMAPQTPQEALGRIGTSGAVGVAQELGGRALGAAPRAFDLAPDAHALAASSLTPRAALTKKYGDLAQAQLDEGVPLGPPLKLQGTSEIKARAAALEADVLQHAAASPKQVWASEAMKGARDYASRTSRRFRGKNQANAMNDLIQEFEAQHADLFPDGIAFERPVPLSQALEIRRAADAEAARLRKARFGGEKKTNIAPDMEEVFNLKLSDDMRRLIAQADPELGAKITHQQRLMGLETAMAEAEAKVDPVKIDHPLKMLGQRAVSRENLSKRAMKWADPKKQAQAREAKRVAEGLLKRFPQIGTTGYRTLLHTLTGSATADTSSTTQ